MKNNLRKSILLASLILTSVLLSACGDDVTPPPPPTNTTVNIQSPATLVGNYEMIAFKSITDFMGSDIPLGTDNLSQIQSFKGQATISFSNNQLNIVSKVQLESVFMDAMSSIMGDLTMQLTRYPAINNNYDVASSSIIDGDNKIELVDNVVTITTKMTQSVGDTSVPVTVIVQLKKVNDTVFALDNTKYWANNDSIIIKDNKTNPQALTSYYRITGTDSSSDVEMAEGGAFRGNISIIFDISKFSVSIYYKFQDPGNADAEWQGYNYGVAKYDIKRAIDVTKLDASIAEIFSDIGVVVTGGKSLKMTLKDGTTKEVTNDAGVKVMETFIIPEDLKTRLGGKSLVLNLEKLYDGNLFGEPTANQHPKIDNVSYYK